MSRGDEIFQLLSTGKFKFSLLYIKDIMGNNQLQNTKRIVLQEREELLTQQIKSVLLNAEQLRIDAVKAQKIGNLTVVDAVRLLNQNQLTSEELLTALAFRTVTLAKQLNLFTYLYFNEALQIARECDQKRKQTKKKNITIEIMAKLRNEEERKDYLPCLFGIPISIKDVYHFQGRRATIGLIANSNQKFQESTLIFCLRNAGMVPFVQTNVPQLGMTTETGNNLWGRSSNPWNKTRAVGGSSGGEGAMISLRCSLLGVGSDIGGSIRIPSEHCGVFGLKPNSKRIANSYHASLSKAFECFAIVIPNSIGPLARSAQDLALFMSVVTTEEYYKNQYDAYNRIVPFDCSVFLKTRNQEKKYRIGVMRALQDLEPSTASQRALSEVQDILKQAGHELVPIQVPDQKEIIREFISEYVSTGCKIYRDMLKGEKPVKDYQTLFMVGQLRAPGRFITSFITRLIMPRTYFYFFQKAPIKTVLQYQTHVGQFNEYRSNWIKYWREKNLDFVITPGFGCQAFPHQKSETLGLTCAYTFIWNSLDMFNPSHCGQAPFSAEDWLSVMPNLQQSGWKILCNSELISGVGGGKNFKECLEICRWEEDGKLG